MSNAHTMMRCVRVGWVLVELALLRVLIVCLRETYVCVATTVMVHCNEIIVQGKCANREQEEE